MVNIDILLTVTFLSFEFDKINESSITSLVCHNCDPDIVVLNKFDPLSVEFVEVEFVNRLVLNIVEVVTSEFCSVESFTFEVVELDIDKFELYNFELVSIIDSVKFELFVIELCICDVDVIIYLTVEFCIVDVVNVESCRFELL